MNVAVLFLACWFYFRVVFDGDGYEDLDVEISAIYDSCSLSQTNLTHAFHLFYCGNQR